jgi:hypothetical protein
LLFFDEQVKILCTFNNVPSPIIVKLETGKVTVSIVDKTGFSQILVSVSADAEDTKI